MRTVERLGLTTVRPVTGAPTAAAVMHASDSDDEVRRIVRDVVSRLATTPAHKVAVLYGNSNPYARLLHEHLSSAGVPINGPGVKSTAERTVPRAFVELLELEPALHLLVPPAFARVQQVVLVERVRAAVGPREQQRVPHRQHA